MIINELRIGNWVKHRKHEAKYVQICEVLTTRILIKGEPPLINIKHISVPLQHYEGIPLTPEILEKCGFNIIDDNPKQKAHYKGDVLCDIAGFRFSNSGKDGFYSYDINNGNTVFKYLHQLQNLYWSLLGEELTYTP